jgi:hypothetical protein
MSAFPMTQFEPIVEAAFRPFEDNVRRWRDLDIAEWLGLEPPREIRRLIERNRSELERHGGLWEQATNPGEQGGRPGTEFCLNFKQAMVICTLSRTARAEDVRFVMISVFEKFVNGEVSTAPRMELRALEVAADRIVAPILHEQREFHSQVLTRMDHHEGRLIRVEHKITDIERQVVGKRRREFPEEVRAQYVEAVDHYYRGLCPCCRSTIVVREGQLLADGEFDHWHSPSKRQANQGWLVCKDCNGRLFTDSEYKTSKHSAFIEFQQALALNLKRRRGQLLLGL